MKNFKIINDLEFSVTTSKPVVTLDSIVSDFGNGLQVVPKKYYEKEGAKADEHPIGTGPWKFVSYTLGVEAVYEAVKDHFYRSPKFDRLVLKEVPDSAARLTQLQSGAVDMALLDSGLIGEATAAGLEVRTIPGRGQRVRDPRRLLLGQQTSSTATRRGSRPTTPRRARRSARRCRWPSTAT